ncbi:hypothetical protein MCEMRE20_00054 [Candidatus Nanopelagicaceae bacterium]
MLYSSISFVRNKIAILLGAPLTSQNLERIGSVTLNHYFEVIVLDCLSWVYPDSSYCVFEKTEWNSVLKIENLRDLEEFFTRNEVKFAIDFIGATPIRNEIARILKENNSRLVVQKLGLVPNRIGFWMRCQEVLNIFKKEILKKKVIDNLNVMPTIEQSEKIYLFQKFLNRLLGHFLKSLTLRMNNPFIVLQPGGRFSSWESIFAAKIIRICSNDYHKFVNTNTNTLEKNMERQKIAVFIDDCLTEALDWQILGITAPINKSKYFESLNTFFDEIEKQFDVNVVIAGHPNTYNNPDYTTNFVNRPLLYGITSQVVRESSFVMVHASTATTFAVLAQKKIIVITSEDIERTHIGRAVHALRYSLGATLVNLSSKPEKITITGVNQRRYRKYERRFIKGSLTTEEEPMHNFVKYAILKSV